MFRRNGIIYKICVFGFQTLVFFVDECFFLCYINQQNSETTQHTRPYHFHAGKSMDPNYSLRLLAMLYSAFVFAYMPAAGLSLNSPLAIQAEFG